ncbi:MAG: SGNH/GDSL hydrolase family protein [Rhodospirillales bacterium]|nr:SGNH/GDSL hydrolase family protein [Rhodospirillales bacterium]
MNSATPIAGHQRTVKVIFYCVVALIIFAIFEIGIRVFELFGPRTFAFRQFDPLLGVSLIPNASGTHRSCFDGYVSINAQGLRDASRQITKRPGAIRIGLFGDSVVEGVHVYPDQVVNRRLEAHLNRNLCDGKCEVINFSVGGYGTLQHWMRFGRDGKPFGLDVVVLVFFGNDVQDNLPGSTFDSNLYSAPYMVINPDGSDTVHPPAKSLFYSPIFYLSKHSALFRFMYKCYYHNIFVLFRHRNSHKHRIYISHSPIIPLDLISWDSDLGKKGWALTERIMTRFSEDAKGSGATFVVFHSEYQVLRPTDQNRKAAEEYRRETGKTVDLGSMYLTKQVE